MFNLPNILTLSRLALLPLLVWFLYISSFWAIWAAFGIYVFGAVTDFLDGWAARKFDQKTAFGTFLDPIADKIYVAAVLIMLVAMKHIMGLWVFLPLIILAREFLVSGLREFLGPHKVQFPVTRLAKWKTATQMISLGLLIIGPLVKYAHEAGLAFLALATLLTAITGWGYLKSGLAHMKKIA